MMVHSGYIHITSNITGIKKSMSVCMYVRTSIRKLISVQLMLGLPLEIVHGPVRIGVVYLAGVLTGALVCT